MSNAPAQPQLHHTLSELPRAGLEAARLAFGYRDLVEEVPRGDGHPVLVLPSYGLGDAGMAPLRRFLLAIGYQTPRSGIALNLDRGEMRIRRVEDAARFRALQVEHVVSRVREIHEETGQRPSLVGWSMGGLFAFDAARELPESVRQVVTMGSPFGDPRGTSLWGVLRWLSGSDVPVDEQDFSVWLDRACTAETRVPVTVLYSDSDGIVGREVARVRRHGLVRHGRVTSSHLGFATNRVVYRRLAEALASSD